MVGGAYACAAVGADEDAELGGWWDGGEDVESEALSLALLEGWTDEADDAAFAVEMASAYRGDWVWAMRCLVSAMSYEL